MQNIKISTFSGAIKKNRHTHFSQNVYDGFQPHIKIYYFYNPWASFPSFS